MALDAKIENREPIKNIDDYEREKVETTVKELRLAASTFDNALIMLDFASEKGIPVPNRTSLDWIRRDPDGSIMKGITDSLSLAQKLQAELAANIPVELKDELERRFVK